MGDDRFGIWPLDCARDDRLGPSAAVVMMDLEFEVGACIFLKGKCFKKLK